ncbi:MAG: ethylbenzene dehydrogenase-related protein [Acidimicrobiia bacterium]|nr:ethylbenzene dehydrogenase-related protein [Acidimicrobiia bacterium]
MRFIRIAGITMMLALILAACGSSDETTTTEGAVGAPETTTTEAMVATTTTEAMVATTTTEAMLEVPEGTLVSVATDAPTLDGVADDGAWAGAPVTTVAVSGGANSGGADVSLQSVYSGDTVYFLVSWDDPTESYLRSPWEKQDDGSWAKLKDPNDNGGDNNLWYEDKMSIIWNTDSAIEGFESSGCFVMCHAGEDSDAKPYGNKYTAAEGQIGDIWHWKSVRNLHQIDDQYVDSVRYSADTPGAGRHGDPSDGGGYTNNENEDKTLPAFMSPDGGAKDGSPGYILDSEKVEFDDSLFVAGDRVPGIYKAEFTGDRSDISAEWTYADGTWTVEIARAMTTGSEFDVQFSDMGATYYFGVATFDNAQVRHSFQVGVTPFVFAP